MSLHPIRPITGSTVFYAGYTWTYDAEKRLWRNLLRKTHARWGSRRGDALWMAWLEQTAWEASQ